MGDDFTGPTGPGALVAEQVDRLMVGKAVEAM